MVSNSFFHRLRVQCPSWTSSLSSSHTFQRSTLSVLNHVDIPTLLSICGREGNFHLGSSLHASIVKKPEFYVSEDDGVYRNSLVVWNSLLSKYTKCGGMVNAFKLFDDMPMKDTVSWNTLISGYLRDGEFDTGIRLLKRMRETNIYRPDKATITTILSGCDSPELCNVARMVHGVVFTNGLEKEITVGNALITSYFKVGFFCSGRQVFDEMCERNVISWTAVMSGLAQNELYEHSLNLFVEMRKGVIDPNSLTYLSSITACSGLQAIEKGRQIHGIVLKLGFESDLCIESALMDMYSKCGSVDDAWKLFELAEALDEVSITVILVGFAQNGFEEEAVRIFIKMLRAGLEIDSNVVSAILGVFGADTSLGLGKQIHSLIIKRSMNLNPFVSNGLINMYSKCGDLKDSIKVFARMPIRSSISWNSMIAGFARHGDGSTALELYEKMRSDGVEPTDVTFLSLLHACSHVGLVDKGMEFLNSMEREFGIPPRTEHYACVVDMLGRAGLLHEAESFIKRLPVKPDALIWQAFLGACSIHGNSQLGKHAAEELLSAVPENPTPYILMANIFSSEGKWKERARAIKRMKEVGIAKETGISWIEVEKKIHSFVVYDRMHPQSETIYWVLKELFGLMRDEGYVPDRRFILYYLDEDEKDST